MAGSTHDARVLATAIREDPMYDIATQRSVIFATMGLHNFIRQNNIQDSDFDNIGNENDVVQAEHIENEDQENNDGVRVEEASEAGAYMRIVRDQIAEQIWSENRRGPRRRH
ncbi:unnamed protein product [Arabis nemorensis]|uniref:Uncharacterized protein n=1 Tax=Arabis nemorensis TaxID=586526 RepID=A0A565BLY4_9BRAS|nr:unnamed protein product [Arabis nemorensis]